MARLPAKLPSRLSHLPIQAVLNHEIAVGSTVTVAGWVRSRRTSRGGFSFIDVHDGSCFDGVQVIADEDLGNYEDITRLGAGCAVRVTGTAAIVPQRDADSVLDDAFAAAWGPYRPHMGAYVRIAVTAAEMILSPAYDLGLTEDELRKTNLEKLNTY